MARPTKPSRIAWLNFGVEPSGAKKSTGHTDSDLDKPTDDQFNWLWGKLTKIQDWFSGFFTTEIIISSDSNEADFPDLASYIGGTPAADDHVMLQIDETITADMTIPNGIKITVAKGKRIITSTDGVKLVFGSDITIIGELKVEFEHTGVTALGISFDGDRTTIENLNINNSSSGTLTLAVQIQSGKLNNFVDSMVQNSGTITTLFTDSSANNTNKVTVFDGTQAVRSNGLKTFSNGITWDQGSDADGDIPVRDGGVVVRLPKGETHTALIADEEDSNQPKWQAIELQTTIEDYGASEFIQGVDYNGTIFVAVGEGNSIATSTDGLSWTQRTSGLAAGVNFFDIVWDPNNSLWIAVGGESAVSDDLITSPDGITWTPRTHNLTTLPVCIGTDESSLLVAGGTGEVSTSPDGINWTLRTITAVITIQDVFHDKSGLWVIVGPLATLETSPDGINWTVRTSGFGASAITSVVHSQDRSLWVATGSAKIATSPDGINWTLRQVGVANIHGLTVIDGKSFIGVGEETLEAAIYVSDGGFFWKRIATVFGDTADRSLRDVTYANGRIVIATENGKILAGFSNLL